MFALVPPRPILVRQVPGIEHIAWFDLAQSPDGQIKGFIYSDTVAKKIVVLDENGNLFREVPLDFMPTRIIHRYSANGDTVAVYAESSKQLPLYSTAYYGLTLVLMTKDTVITKTVWRTTKIQENECWETQKLYSALHFRTYPGGEQTVVFGFSVYIDCILWTVGPYWSTWTLTTEYSLDLSTVLQTWPTNDNVRGNFFGDSALEYCGSRYDKSGYNWPGWVEYPYQVSNDRTFFWAQNVPDSANQWTSQSRAWVMNMFSGPFDPADGYDDIAVYGRGNDWLGLHPSYGLYMACYSLANQTLAEKWYVPLGGKQILDVYPPESCFVGLASCNSVAVLKYRTGQFTTPLPLDRCLDIARFVSPASPTQPLRIIARKADTLIVYEFDQLVDVPNLEHPLPESFELSQNYPNPFNPSTTISYSLPRRSDVTIEIFNLLGQRVRTLVDESQSSGPHKVEWDGRDAEGKTVSSGVYLYRLKAEGGVLSRKMILLK